jgi:hypothetical protein
MMISMGLDDRKPVTQFAEPAVKGDNAGSNGLMSDARRKRKDVASFAGFGRLCVYARDDLETHRSRG